MKAIEQYFHVVLFNMLYKVTPTLTSFGLDCRIDCIKSSSFTENLPKKRQEHKKVVNFKSFEKSNKLKMLTMAILIG